MGVVQGITQGTTIAVTEGASRSLDSSSHGDCAPSASRLPTAVADFLHHGCAFGKRVSACVCVLHCRFCNSCTWLANFGTLLQKDILKRNMRHAEMCSKFSVNVPKTCVAHFRWQILYHIATLCKQCARRLQFQVHCAKPRCNDCAIGCDSFPE